MYHVSPYQSALNNPISYADPDGDLPWLAIGIAAGLQGIGGGINATNNGGSFLGGFAKGVVIGGATAAATTGVGGLFGHGVGSFGTELARAGAHGAIGGLSSAANGGDFGSGFLGSAVSSGFASALDGATGLNQYIGGALSGGLSNHISDGNFIDHLGQGLTHGFMGAAGGAVLGGVTGAAAHWLSKAPGAVKPTTIGKESNILTEGPPQLEGSLSKEIGNLNKGLTFEGDGFTVRAYRQGTFNIKDWGSYPAGISKPSGPFRLLEGAEYKAARRAANKFNEELRQDLGIHRNGNRNIHVHEIHPIKFGGDPTSLTNRIILKASDHRRIENFWTTLRAALNKK